MLSSIVKLGKILTDHVLYYSDHVFYYSDWGWSGVLFPLQDWFHYFLVYDPQQKTLVADRGEMGIGTAYQAQVPKTARRGRGHSKKHSICLCTSISFFKKSSANVFWGGDWAGWKELVRDIRYCHAYCTSSCVSKNMPEKFLNPAAICFSLQFVVFHSV